MTPEAKVKVALRRRLADLGCYVFMPVQTGYGCSTLDFLICWNGKFIAIETKAPGEKMGVRQLFIARQIIAAGGTVALIDNEQDAKNFEPGRANNNAVARSDPIAGRIPVTESVGALVPCAEGEGI